MSVGFGACGEIVALIDDHAAIAMDLIEAGERRIGQRGIGDALPVFGDQRRIVARPESAVERGELASGHAAAAAEETVRDAVQRGCGNERRGHRSSRKMRSSST